MHWHKMTSTNWHRVTRFIKNNPALIWTVVLTLLVLFYLLVWLPLTHIGIPCPVLAVTGFYCPGCGMTRAAISLLHLDIYQSFRYNALLFFIPPLYGIYHLANKYKWKKSSGTIMLFMLFLTIGYGIARNMPLLSWMAPTALP